MPPRCTSGAGLFLPFLYPSLHRAAPSRVARATITTLYSASCPLTAPRPPPSHLPSPPDHARPGLSSDANSSADLPRSHLNPAPDDYALSSFADKAQITVHAGPGGHGCISFLREAFVAQGPANGGDGGHGGNVYVQAVHSETSLHRIARRRIMRAERGKTGQGSARGGARGEDVIIQVPVGTVVRELDRVDPAVAEALHYRQAREKEREYRRLVREAEQRAADAALAEGRDPATEEDVPLSDELYRKALDLPEAPDHPNLDKFMLYPGISNSERRNLSLPRLPRRERLYAQPEGPIHLDLSEPTPRPILLAAGGLGGLGNPHFVSKERQRPLFATKGEPAVTMRLELELKLLADVGLVGLPNAGKSTLLRALTRSRARVGNWAFTTLQPNIGTVVLDSHKGRALPVPSRSRARAAAAGSNTVVQDAKLGRIVVSSPSSSSSDNPYMPLPNSTSSYFSSASAAPAPRSRFTVADIPGLIEGAHLDRGLGVAFLRHVERAGVLAFVVDLSAGDAVAALKALWAEVGLYARMRDEEERERRVAARIDWEGDGVSSSSSLPSDAPAGGTVIDPASLLRGGGGGGINGRRGEPEDDGPGDGDEVGDVGLHIAAKPWFVVATKGDVKGTEANYAALRDYLAEVTAGSAPHPSGVPGAWSDDCAAIPVSAIRGHGVDRIIHWIAGLLDD